MEQSSISSMYSLSIDQQNYYKSNNEQILQSFKFEFRLI